jgi:hypothetical protein
MTPASTLSDSAGRVASAALTRLMPDAGSVGSVAALSIDGLRFYAMVVLDAQEDSRRRSLGLGAVTDRRLLHALWTLPEDVPVPWEDVDPVDAETLRSAGLGVVDADDEAVCRTYRPPGDVTSVVVVASRLGTAIEQVGELPPIFSRLAVATGATPPDAGEVDLARCYGIGAAVQRGSEATMIVEPAPPQLGVPAVYRWWVNELAYRNAAYTT